MRVPKHAQKELEGFLDCGLLCRGFARVWCASCNESRLVAFACRGRAFCPSCTGRRMCATSATLIDHVLPAVDLRQWVLTFPFAWRRRLACDGALLARLTRIVVDVVQGFYAQRAAKQGAGGAKTGAITVVQRTSSDLRLNPHLHLVLLDGTYGERGAELGDRRLAVAILLEARCGVEVLLHRLRVASLATDHRVESAHRSCLSEEIRAATRSPTPPRREGRQV